MLEAVRQKSIDPSISKRLAAAIIRILYSPVSKVADWRPTTEPARGSNPWGPTERRSGPVRNGRWDSRGKRRTRPEEAAIAHCRSPFSTAIQRALPRLHSMRLHTSPSPPAFSDFSRNHDATAPPSSRELFLRCLAFGFRSSFYLSLSLFAIEIN